MERENSAVPGNRHENGWKKLKYLKNCYNFLNKKKIINAEGWGKRCNEERWMVNWWASRWKREKAFCNFTFLIELYYAIEFSDVWRNWKLSLPCGYFLHSTQNEAGFWIRVNWKILHFISTKIWKMFNKKLFWNHLKPVFKFMRQSEILVTPSPKTFIGKPNFTKTNWLLC